MSSATSSATPSGRRSWQGSSPLPETGALSTIRFFPFIISPPRTAPVIRTFSGAEMSFCPSPSLFLCFSVAKSSSKSSLENLLRFSVFLRKTFSFFSAFRCRKAAKATRPIPMPASERLKAASGDCAGLQANRPRRCRFQPSVRFFAIGTKSGIALRKKKKWSCEGGWFCETKVTRSRRRAGQVS